MVLENAKCSTPYPKADEDRPPSSIESARMNPPETNAKNSKLKDNQVIHILVRSHLNKARVVFVVNVGCASTHECSRRSESGNSQGDERD